MPQVPRLQQSEYTGVNQIAPSEAMTPGISVNAPLAAFGGAQAAGMEALSKGLGDLGNELFTRAKALQDLNNQAEVNQAEADHIIKQGELSVGFGELKGAAAKDAYPKFVADSEALRQQMRGSLSNPMAQKMFDARSLSTMAYGIRHATGHAASEFSKYQISAAQSKKDAIGDQALSQPMDSSQWSQALQEDEAQTRHQSQLVGHDAAQTEQDVAVSRSNLTRKRIVGISDTQPFVADTLMREAIANGHLRGADIEPVQKVVRDRARTVGARNIAQQVASQSASVAGVPGGFVAEVKKSEGFTPTAKWDFKQWSSGYGTKGQPGETITQAEGNRRFQIEFEKATAVVDKVNPNLTPGTRAAMASLTYNAGADWVKGKLGEAIAKGDETAARELFLQYNKAGGQVNAGLVARRQREAAWFGQQDTAKPSVREQVDQGRALAAQLAPDDPLLPDYVEQRVLTNSAQEHRIKLDDDFNNRQTVEGGILGGDKGKIPTTVEELRAQSPEIQAAWDNLDNSKKRYYIGVLAKNAKGDRALTQEGLRRWSILKGMAGDNPAQFLETNILDEDLPISTKKELLNLQDKVKKVGDTDPRMQKYMADAAGELLSAGIQSKSDDWYLFRGIFQDVIHQYEADNKRPPKAEEVQLMRSRLLRQLHSSTFWFNFSKDYAFRLPVPSSERDRITEFLKQKNNGVEPTDIQIQRFYHALEYTRQFGSPTKSE